MVSGQIDEGDELRRVLADLLRCAALGVVDGVALGVETQDLVGYRRRPTGLDLVKMSVVETKRLIISMINY